MTKSKAKGGKNRRKCKRSKFTNDDKILEFKDTNQEYAFVVNRKGGPHVTLKLFPGDGNEILGVIRGSMRKRVWINSGDIVLVGLREFQKDKVDIILKYDDNQVRKLVQYGELTKHFVEDNKFVKNGEDFLESVFEFENIDDI